MATTFRHIVSNNVRTTARIDVILFASDGTKQCAHDHGMSAGLHCDPKHVHAKNRQNGPKPQMCGKLHEDACAGRVADHDRVREGVAQCCTKFGGRGRRQCRGGAAHVVRISPFGCPCVAYISVRFVFYRVRSFLLTYFPAREGWGAHYSEQWVALPAPGVT